MGKKYHVTLTDSERQTLQELVRRRSGKSAVVKRAYILLAADEGGDMQWKDEQIQQVYQVGLRTVERVRQRFVEAGLTIAVHGKPREVYKEKVFDGEVEAHLIALRCSAPPAGRARWTLHLLADKMVELEYVEAISHESVRQILKKNKLKPWRVKGWVIPEASAEFVCAMEEVLTVYQRPYDAQHPVVCFDESPQQLIGERRAAFTDHQGVEYIDYEYTREGTADLYMIVEPLGGRRETHVRDRHTSRDWAEEVAYIVEEMYPDAQKITLVQDNLSAHKKAALYERFAPARARAILNKLEFVFTPKHGSWLNIAEIELSVLTRQALPPRVASRAELEQCVTAWYKQRNAQSRTVDWHFTTHDARIKLKRLYPSFNV